MAERGNAVIVTIQYRLGPLGFLVHPGLEAEDSNGVAGNYAVLDQILALKWVQSNIGNFGGDSTKIMIFGESAGGVNVGNLLVSPLAAGIFQRACIESAIPDVNDYNDSKNEGIAFVDSFTTVGTGIQKIEYMRTLSSDSIMYFETSPIEGGVVQMKWRPAIDGIAFTDYPKNIFQSGSFNKVPLIIGSNSEEMSLSAPETVFPIMVTALINNIVPPAQQDQAHLLYPSGSNQTEARDSYIAVLTDGQFTSTTRRTAQCVSQNQTMPVWRYFFTHKHTIAQLADLGSYHGMELFYVFNNWENATLGSGILFKPADDSVQKAMLNYWVNFASTGNPNGTGLVNWPQFHSSTDCYLEIDATPNGSQCGLRTPQCNLWDDVAGFSECTSSYTISASVNPVNSGTITGTGNYQKSATVSITATAEEGYTFVNWTENGTPVSTNSTYSFLADGNRILVANFMNSVDIENVLSRSELKFYPNPANGIFQLIVPEDSKDFEVGIYNSTGEKIYISHNSNQIDISNQSNGIYIIEVKTNREILKGKIIKTE
jgi:carboxylesterase type B